MVLLYPESVRNSHLLHCAATQEALFRTQLLCDMDTNCQYEPVTIFEDNQGAIALVDNPVHHQRSKHIDTKCHFIRDECHRGKINVVYMPTSDMVADIFTKPSKYKFNQFHDVLFGK